MQDMLSNRTGTLEIPLPVPVPPEMARLANTHTLPQIELD
jgi:hypothetical protein